MKYAIIGGTGFYQIDGREEAREIENEYGKAVVYEVETDGFSYIFLPRHGIGHSVAPHKINYKANIKALKDLGVEVILTTAAVGSLNENYKPGDVVMIEDFLDFTKNRDSTFFDGEELPLKHIDMSEPYCLDIIEKFEEEGKKQGFEIKGRGVYACTEGPRFETAAEIRMFEKLGVDVVGMTSVPEVVLAKELGICYSTIGIITNWCTGFKGDIPHGEIRGIVDRKRKEIVEISLKLFKNGDLLTCNCKEK